MFNAASPAQLDQALSRHGISLKKSLGQNFLIDENILKKIIEASGAQKGSIFLEIGPGAGALTQKLCGAGAHVVAVEIDRALIPLLHEALQGMDAKVICQDILKTDLDALYESELKRPFKVCANLPYYITSPVIFLLLGSGLPILSMTFMVQAEVARRMAAERGKDYSPFSIAVQYHAEVRQIARVAPTCFMPRPDVASAIIRLDMRKEKTVRVSDEKLFFALVRQSFAMRRKTLVNNLSAGDWGLGKPEWEQFLAACGIGPSVRAEEIMIKDFANLSNMLYKMLNSIQQPLNNA